MTASKDSVAKGIDSAWPWITGARPARRWRIITDEGSRATTRRSVGS